MKIFGFEIKRKKSENEKSEREKKVIEVYNHLLQKKESIRNKKDRTAEDDMLYVKLEMKANDMLFEEYDILKNVPIDI